MKLPKLKREQIIEVNWIDITSTTSWKATDEAENYAAVGCHSVGYFINEDNDVIRISSTKNDEDERDVNVIVKGCIKSINRLKR